MSDRISPNLSKVLATNSTAASFASKVPTVTEPTGAGVLTLSTSGYMSSRLLLIPYGGDADNNTFKLRVIGWKNVSTLWIPVVLCELTCTLSAVTGVNASVVENELFFCDTLALATGYSSVQNVVSSPAADVVAHATVDLKGFSKVEVTFDRNSSAAQCNALYSLL